MASGGRSAGEGDAGDVLAEAGDLGVVVAGAEVVGGVAPQLQQYLRERGAYAVLRADTGWSLTVPMEEGVRRAYAWYRAEKWL